MGSGEKSMVSWDPVRGATSYNVKLQKMQNGSPVEDIWKTSDYTGSPSVTVSGTKRDSDYKWTVSTKVKGCVYSVSHILRKDQNGPVSTKSIKP